MNYTFRLSKQARNYLRRLEPRLRDGISLLISELCSAPFDDELSQPLHGRMAGLRRARFSEHRIVFRVESDILVVVVVRIGPRGDVYKG